MLHIERNPNSLSSRNIVDHEIITTLASPDIKMVDFIANEEQDGFTMKVFRKGRGAPNVIDNTISESSDCFAPLKDYHIAVDPRAVVRIARRI